MSENPNLSVIPDFYANMVNFGITIWDLRMLFGQMIRQGEEEIFNQKAAITIPWTQAKAMSIYLQMNIFIHEKTNGRIDVPAHLLPSPAVPSGEDPTITAAHEIFRKKLAQILAIMEDLDPK